MLNEGTQEQMFSKCFLSVCVVGRRHRGLLLLLGGLNQTKSWQFNTLGLKIQEERSWVEDEERCGKRQDGCHRVSEGTHRNRPRGNHQGSLRSLSDPSLTD